MSRSISPRLFSFSTVIGLGLLLTLFSAKAQAYVPQEYRWTQEDLPLSFEIDPAGAPGLNDGSDLTAIRSAFDSWEAVTCSLLTFEEKAWTAPSIVSRDLKNKVFWAKTQAEWGYVGGQPTTLALTFAFYDLQTKRAQDADIILNGVDWMWTTAQGSAGNKVADVETVVLHEIGHFFGLGHTNDANAVMYPQNNAAIRRQPASDDQTGVCALYPDGMALAPIGAPCQQNPDCASSVCVEDSGDRYCSAACTPSAAETCPLDFPCQTTPVGDFCLKVLVSDELCDQCQSGEQCNTGLCLSVPGYNQFKPFCTRACDPAATGVNQCPESYHCEPIAMGNQTGGVCAPNTGICDPLGKGGHNEYCYANNSCKPNHVCIQYFASSGPNFCYLQCSPSLAGVSCSDTQAVVCTPLPQSNAFGRMNIAACLNIAKVSEPCIPEVCDQFSVCALSDDDDFESATCYQTCTGNSCAANTQCQNIEGLGPICVPNSGFLPLGSSCLSNEECKSRKCRSYGMRNLCTLDCATTEAGSCPSGLRCLAPTNNTAGLCWPANSSVPEGSYGEELPENDICYCDITSVCDDNCTCDSECGDDESCSCQSVVSTSSFEALLLLMLSLLCLNRRRLTSGFAKQ